MIEKIEYSIVTGSAESVVRTVNSLMESRPDGTKWVLAGGVSIMADPSGHGLVYAQALTRTYTDSYGT